jgi:hypothetical protein
MSPSGAFFAGRNAILRRLGVIEARLNAAARRTREVRESVESETPEADPVHRLEEIEASLEELEGRLRNMERDMRQKESPPETLGTTSQFSTGRHFPGLG